MSDPELVAVEDENLGEEGAAETRPSSPSSRQVLGLIGLIVGLLTAFLTCVLVPLLPLAVFLLKRSAFDGALIQQSLALLALGLGLGSLVAWEGWRVWQGKPSSPFRPRRVLLLWLAGGLLFLAGLLLSLVDAVSPYLLPPVNTLMMILLPFLLLTLIGQVTGGRGNTWRDVNGGLVSGAALGVVLALIAELTLAGTLLGLALALGWIPGGLAGLRALLEQMQDPAFFSDLQNLAPLLSPGTVLGALLLMAVLVPAAEELAKTAGLGIAGLWLRPGPLRAFVIGVASGAGFAMAENLFNGALIGTLWGPGIVMRLGATLMHCAASGLMGWGWGQLWGKRRPLRLALAFLGAVAVHGLWNGLTVGIAASSLSVAGQQDNPLVLALVGLFILAALSVLVLMALAALAGLIWAAWALARREAEALTPSPQPAGE